MIIEKTIKKPDETSKERFKRLATKRTNEVLRKLKVLGNCANRQAYEYSRDDVNKIFSVIHQKVKEIEAKFRASSDENFKL
jgi:uncharacterized protein YehS (DUF1456 family)